MRHVLRSALAGLVTSLALAALPAAAAPLEAYGELPTIEQIAISPSGRLLAIDVVRGDQRTILVQDIDARKIVTGLRTGDAKVRRLDWAGDDHLIITSSSTSHIPGVLGDRGEYFVAADYNISTRRVTPLLGDIELAGNMLDSYPVVREVNGKPKVFATGFRIVGDESKTTLFRVDLDTDRSSPVIDAGGRYATEYMVGSDGRPAAMAQYDAQSKEWLLKVWQGGVWRQAQARTASIETPDLLGLGRDGRSILVGQYEDGAYDIRELAADGSGLGDPLPGGGATEELIHDPATHRLIGTATLQGDAMTYDFFDPTDDLKWRAVAAAFPGQSVRLESSSNDRQRLVVRLDSPTDGPGYALVDLASRTTTFLGADYPALTPNDIASVTPITFKAADGLELTGYLTLPRGARPKNLPLVVFPHGGPAVRDEPGFDWWAQAMASRGYAVLQVNYRGSAGFGWKFMSAGFGEWGRKMQTDLSDGVRDLAGQGIVDPKRVCIVGGSYGGYAALAGATLDPGVYRCAVDVAGLSDLGKFVAWANDRSDVSAERYWDRFMGAKNPGDPRMAEVSPVDHVDKVTIPILIIHGKDDTVVPFEQSQLMADALRRAGKPYDFVVLNHEDHWLSRGDTRLQMLQATIDFLLKNNPPG